MIVWKLATRPATATRPRSDADVPEPKIVFRPSSSGSEDSPIAFDPGLMPEFRKRIRNAVTTSVQRPQMVPRGMSRLGSADSSAASGSSSMARKNQIAKGNA